MNYKPKAEKIISEILHLTDEKYLCSRINHPIEQAVLSFEIEGKDPVTQQRLLFVIGNFIHHLQERDIGIKKKLSELQAQSEALAILDQHYRNSTSQGYYAAFLDATNPDLDGLNVIISQMADIIITVERKKHIDWVYTARIESLDWKEKTEIVDVLLESWEPFLPPSILGCSPAQLADHLPQLINILHTTDEAVRNIVGYVNYYD